jgi:hypothetical protein
VVGISRSTGGGNYQGQVVGISRSIGGGNYQGQVVGEIIKVKWWGYQGQLVGEIIKVKWWGYLGQVVGISRPSGGDIKVRGRGLEVKVKKKWWGVRALSNSLYYSIFAWMKLNYPTEKPLLRRKVVFIDEDH